MLKKFLLPTLFVFLFSLNIFAQNKFEGNNIILDVPESQTAAACAIRYAPPTASVTITDLDRSTPLKISACSGSGTSVTQTGASSATMRANAINFKWCFQGEDKKYRISFAGDQFAPNVSYDWIATPENPGFYSIKDFGATGDGQTDDTAAIKSAMVFIATRNGGTLNFPEGEYIVTSPIVLPSGIVIQGVSGLQSNSYTNNVNQKSPSRITLRGTNRAVFRIGECTEKITLRDLELFAANSQQTYGVEAVGAFTSSQDFYFERVAFSNFYRGIYAHGLNVTNQGWQFDYIKINHCRFIYNSDAGIYSDVKNSDWKIQSSLFLNPARTLTQKANSMHFEHSAGVMVQDTFGGGFQGALGGTFLDILDSSVTTVIGSQTESMTNSLVFNQAENPYAGDYSYPITFLNNVFGDPIEFKARRTFVSTGNFYGPRTFKADERLRVYSTGDRFCYDGGTLGCGSFMKALNQTVFDRATVVFMTGQPDDFSVKGHPTFFGTDVQFGAPVQMPSILQNVLPPNKPNGSMVYCANCRRDTTPCQAGGSGAPAMVVSGQWSCL